MARPILGIITNNQHEVFQHNIITGVRRVAADRGYDLIIDSYAEDDPTATTITLDYRAVDGVLVIASAAPPDLLHDMYAAGIPLSLVSHQVADLPIPAVITDNEQGIATLVKHLIVDCDRQKMVFIRGLPGQRDSDERETAFYQELMRHNVQLPPDYVLRGDFTAAIAAQSLTDFLATGADFDAVIASDYLMGIAAVDVLRDAGFAVPDEIAVVAFGDGPEAETAGLTTVAADIVEQGQRAARQVIGQIEGLRMRGVTILSVRLMIRDTSCLAAQA